MYIVTLEEADYHEGTVDDWVKTFREFASLDDAKDFVKFMSEGAMYGNVQNIHVYETREIRFKCDVSIEFCD